MGLGLYTANMFRTMKSGGLQLRANLALAGHPNQFQSKPVAIKLDWDLLQDMDHRTLFDWVHLGTLGTRGGELAATIPD